MLRINNVLSGIMPSQAESAKNQIQFRGNNNSFVNTGDEFCNCKKRSHGFMTSIQGKLIANKAREIQENNSIDNPWMNYHNEKIFNETKEKFKEAFLIMLDTQTIGSRGIAETEDGGHAIGVPGGRIKQYYKNGSMNKIMQIGSTTRQIDIERIEEAQEQKDDKIILYEDWNKTKKNVLTQDADSMTFAQDVTDSEEVLKYGQTRTTGNLRKIGKMITFDLDGNVTSIKKGCQLYTLNKKTILKADEESFYEDGKLIESNKGTVSVSDGSYSAKERYVFSPDGSTLTSYEKGYKEKGSEDTCKQHVAFDNSGKVLYSAEQ